MNYDIDLLGGLCWSEAELVELLSAYKFLFPATDKPFDDYLGLTRPGNRWCVLPTNFHQATTYMLRKFHRSVWRVFESPSQGAAYLLREMISVVGCSVGLNPWADYLLHRTFDVKCSRKLVPIIAHDWYPIVYENPKGIRSWSVSSPLHKYEPEKNYMDALQPLIDSKRDTALLFLNLVPDVRPPCAPVAGQIQDADYRTCASGILHLLSLVNKRLQIPAVISWGSHVWNALRSKHKFGVTKAVAKSFKAFHSTAENPAFHLQLSDGRSVPYYPFCHPCDARSFKKPMPLGDKSSDEQTRHDNWYKELAEFLIPMRGQLVSSVQSGDFKT